MHYVDESPHSDTEYSPVCVCDPEVTVKGHQIQTTGIRTMDSDSHHFIHAWVEKRIQINLVCQKVQS